MERAFVDTDIILDLLQERKPYFETAARLFSMGDRKKVKLFVSALCFTNLHYILRKQFSTDESRKVLARFKVLVQVLPVDDKIIELSLASKFSDVEDAVQYYTAIENKIPVIVTRNLKDYKHAEIPVMTAEGFLRSMIG